MKGDPSISSIYRWGARPDEVDEMATHARLWSIRRTLWRKQGVIAVAERELPPHLREAMRQWADDTYGQRRGQ